MKKGKIAAICAGFLAIICVAVISLSMLVTPNWPNFNNFNTVRGMYAQPKGSVEVGVFGTSIPLSGISPNTLYEEYGISSYNCSTARQPLFVSYYLIKEMKRLQGDSMDTVVIDPTILLVKAAGNSRSAYAERVIMHMDPSLLKLEALWACSKTYKGFDFFEHLIPALAYHSRWSDLTTNDYTMNDANQDFYSHGQFIRYTSNVDDPATAGRTFNFSHITKENTANWDTAKSRWAAKDKAYLDKIVEYCKSENMNLVFVKLPRKGWKDEDHDIMQMLADDYGVPFIDMCDDDIVKQTGLNLATDYVDTMHANALGAQKISSYLGSYLHENYDLKDVRGNSAYSYWESDLEKYHNAIEDASLQKAKTIDEYLDALDRKRYTVFVAVKDDASKSLSESTREKLRELGFTNLADIERRQSYVGIRHKGKVVTDKIAKDTSKSTSMQGSYYEGKLITKKQSLQPGAEVPHPFTLVSKGYDAGNTSSIMIDGEERSIDGIGLNFVVYDSTTHELVDTAWFNTNAGPDRSSDIALNANTTPDLADEDVDPDAEPGDDLG